jgi:hypothetical protein
LATCFNESVTLRSAIFGGLSFSPISNSASPAS